MKKLKLILLLCLIFYPVLSQQKNFYDSYIIKLASSNSLTDFKRAFPGVVLAEKPIFAPFFGLSDKNFNPLLSVDASNKLNHLKNYYKILIPKNQAESLTLFEMKRNPLVISVEKNQIFTTDELKAPNDPLYPLQWGLKTVDALKAWEKASGKDIIIGVVDTGIDWNHEDLKNQLWINSKEDINHNGRFDPWPDTVVINGVTGDLNGKDDDGNGFADDVIGYGFVNQAVKNIGLANELSPIPVDEHGHGTLVSGVIAAERNNGKGIAGLAYNAKIMTLRAFDATGNAQTDNIASAIVYGALNGCKVLNFSFGEDIESTILHDAIKFAYSMGCSMIASSGNNGWAQHHFPSDFEEVISVGYSNKDNARDYQSNYGNRLGLLAPGAYILTTDLNNNYRTASGTSLAAPFVTAAAAMLYELKPDIKPAEVYGLLEQTATDIDSPGWDIKTGSGILNAGKAVNSLGLTDISIISPETGQIFDKSKTQGFYLIGSVAIPLFNYYKINIGTGESPKSWISEGEPIYKQIKNDTLAFISISDLADTSYVLRLTTVQKNNSTIEKRIYFTVSSGNELKILSFKVLNSWFNDKRVTLVAATTSQPVRMKINFRPNNSTEPYTVITDQSYLSQFPLIMLDDAIPAGILMEAQAILDRNDGFKLIMPFSFSRQPDEMFQNNFRPKYNTLPMLYLDNETADFYNDGKACIAANDITDGLWQSTKIFEFSNNEFKLKDTIKDIWLPTGFGDSNGDGIPEIFTKSYGSSVLFQAGQKGNSPFQTKIFADTLSSNLWAAGMYDYNGDGRQELVAYSDTCVHMFAYVNGRYKVIAQTPVDKVPDHLSTAPGVTSGDFDGDGLPELCYSTDKNHVYIFKYINGKFENVFTDKGTRSASPQMMCNADIDGDGIPEIAMLYYGSTALYDREESGEPLWTLKILKAVSPTQYEYVWEDTFYGVRSGSTRAGASYRNGISAGNLDGKAGDEIIVSEFPNLYVFKWNTKKNIMEPFWWYPSAFANSAIVHDFDKNGINEIGFTDFSSTHFYEYKAGFSGPLAPTGFNGFALKDTSCFLRWNHSNDAQRYIIFKLIEINGSTYIQDIAETKSDSIIINGLKPQTSYSFVIQAINSSMPDSASDYSAITEIYTHNPIKLKSALPLNNKIIKLIFTGKIPWEPLEPGNFPIYGSNDTTFATSVNRESDSSAVLILNNYLSKGSYTLYSAQFPDFYKTPSISSQAIFTIDTDFAYPAELYLKKLTVIDEKNLLLEFSEPVSKVDAENLSNYVLRPAGSIESLKLVDDNNAIVQIGLTQSSVFGALGLSYTLTVNNVRSLSGLNMTLGAGNTLGFVFYSPDVSKVFIYPNPVKLSDNPDIVFAGLPLYAEVYITTTEGKLLKKLNETEGNGGVHWDGKDSDGHLLNSGIYLFRVSGKNEKGDSFESPFIKFAIIN